MDLLTKGLMGLNKEELTGLIGLLTKGLKGLLAAGLVNLFTDEGLIVLNGGLMD